MIADCSQAPGAAGLPFWLRDIDAVYVDPSVRDAPLTRRVASRLGHLPWREAPRDGALEGRQPLYLKEYKGRFLRFCPGTRYYRCCGYRIIHIGENCPIDCSYCILRAYFQDRTLKVWANQDALWSELGKAFSTNRELRYRVGTGEFTDSLVLEPLTGYSRDLVAFLRDYPNVCLELKSKIVDLSWLDAARADRVLPAWSLNAPAMVASEEPFAASLEQRLAAARECASAGFRVCLHFDPILRYPGWDSPSDGYAATIEMIFDYLKPEQVAYLSLGSFRFLPDLKRVIETHSPQSRYLFNEFILGLDGKQRLFRPLRVEQFRFLVERLRRGGLDRQLYFCMESDEVWRAVLGRTPREMGGLGRRLEALAFGEEG
jgi:spore photoproduct lyase